MVESIATHVANFGRFVTQNTDIGVGKNLLKIPGYYVIDWFGKATELPKEVLAGRKLLSITKNVASVLELPKKIYWVCSRPGQAWDAFQTAVGDTSKKLQAAGWKATEFLLSDIPGFVSPLNDVVQDFHSAGALAGLVTAAQVAMLLQCSMALLIVSSVYGTGKSYWEMKNVQLWEPKPGEVFGENKKFAAPYKIASSVSYVAAGVIFFTLTPASSLFLASLTFATAFSLLSKYTEAAYNPVTGAFKRIEVS